MLSLSVSNIGNACLGKNYLRKCPQRLVRPGSYRMRQYADAASSSAEDDREGT